MSYHPNDLRRRARLARLLLLAPSDDPFAAAGLPKVRQALTGAAQVVVRDLVGAQIPAMEQCADQVATHVREFLAGLE